MKQFFACIAVALTLFAGSTLEAHAGFITAHVVRDYTCPNDQGNVRQIIQTNYNHFCLSFTVVWCDGYVYHQNGCYEDVMGLPTGGDYLGQIPVDGGVHIGEMDYGVSPDMGEWVKIPYTNDSGTLIARLITYQNGSQVLETGSALS